jgi:hypothetical protein
MLVEARRVIQRDRLALIERAMARPTLGAIAKPLSRHAIDRVAVFSPYHVDLEARCPDREATLIGIKFGTATALCLGNISTDAAKAHSRGHAAAQHLKQAKSRVILLVHRQETMRFLGFPIARYIDINGRKT